MIHLKEQLQELRKSLLEMADLVRGQMKKSLLSLFEGDDDVASEVIYNERRVNALELKIDKDCESIFALLTPVAIDMRFVFASLKINGDLERIGDYAEGIAKLILLGEKKFDADLMEKIQVQKMYDVAYGMLKDVSQAYNEDDAKLARTVFSKDKLLNEINGNVTPIVEDYCKNHPEKIRQALLLLSIIRKLERVGDHVTNIAEEVIFFKEAKVLKHGNKGGGDDK